MVVRDVSRPVVACAAAIVVGVVVLSTMVASSLSARNDADHGVERAASSPAAEAARVASRFLARYLEPDGRVVRHDQGGDTVSEGQAYAMLLGLAADDHAAFAKAWTWAQEHLQRDDGLLAWRWDGGRVLDPMPASDADLDAAWALARADRRWPGRGYGDAAAGLVRAMEAQEIAVVDPGQILAAGPWAVGEPVVVNPSYASPVARGVLARAGLLDGPRIDEWAAGDRHVVRALVDSVGVPTDWAHVSGDGRVEPAASPGEPGRGTFGWDAVRVPLRWAASCDAQDRGLAALVWPALEAGAGLDVLAEHPARLAGAAAAAAAAGDERAGQLLRQATTAAERRPSYYGDALAALAHALLRTDRLGSCPPLPD